MRKLTEIRYERNDLNFVRNAYRVRGDTLEVYPAYWAGRAIRIEFFGDEIDRISEVNAVTGVPERILNHVAIYPASHYVASREKMARAMKDIEAEMWEQVRFFEEHDRCSRRSASASGRSTIWKCCRRSASAPASRIIPASLPAVPPAPRRRRCWTISRTISSSSSMRVM